MKVIHNLFVCVLFAVCFTAMQRFCAITEGCINEWTERIYATNSALLESLHIDFIHPEEITLSSNSTFTFHHLVYSSGCIPVAIERQLCSPEYLRVKSNNKPIRSESIYIRHCQLIL